MKEYTFTNSLAIPPEAFDQMERDARLCNVEFPVAIRAYQGIFAEMYGKYDRTILEDLENSIRKRTTTSRKIREFVTKTRTGCTTLLGLEKDTQVDAMELVATTFDCITKPGYASESVRLAAISKAIKLLDQPSVKSLLDKLNIVSASGSYVNAGSWNWKDTIIIFHNNPDLFGYVDDSAVGVS